MIFVTVGTSRGDELVQCVDAIAEEAGTPIVMQIGKSDSIPKKCEYFRFSEGIGRYYEEADLVIGHGGAGTIFEVLHLGKKYIGVHNRKVANNHQVELLKKLEEEGYILWCRDPAGILGYIRTCQTHAFRNYAAPACTIEMRVRQFIRLNGLDAR